MSKIKDTKQEACPKCGGTLVMVEYPYTSKHRYDGISEIGCTEAYSLNGNCNYRRGRWCEQELADGEVEPPFHAGGAHPRVFTIDQDGGDK